MVNYMTMKVVNVHEAKAKLSEFLDAAAAGERILICKRNQPVAELRAVASARTQPRPIGKAAGEVVLESSFFDPLPEDLLETFSGGGHARESRRARAAEPRAEYKVSPRKRRP